ASAGQVGSGYEAIVASPDDDHIEFLLRHGISGESRAASEGYYGKQRQSNGNAVRPAMPFHALRGNAMRIPYVASAEGLRVRIENFIVDSISRNAESIALAHYRREITAEQDKVIGIFSLAEKRDDGVLDVVKIHPLKSRVVNIYFIECGLLPVKMVDLSYHILQL